MDVFYFKSVTKAAHPVNLPILFDVSTCHGVAGADDFCDEAQHQKEFNGVFHKSLFYPKVNNNLTGYFPISPLSSTSLSGLLLNFTT